MKSPYDFYTEPCQLCISREGNTYDVCGWCHDDDTHYKARDGQYPGDYIRIPTGGDGYPFHAMPHSMRKYFQSDKYIPEMDGAIPPDCEPSDASVAKSSFEATEGILNLFNSGERPAWPVKPNQVESFLKHVVEVEQGLAFNPSGLDVTGKVEFRYLTYTLKENTSIDLEEVLLQARQFCSEDLDDYQKNIRLWKRLKQSNKANIPVLEVVCHEAFHILQAVNMPTVGKRFDAERRLSLLKLLLVEDFFLDRNEETQYGNGLYELLEKLDEESELYHSISRLFGYCQSDIELMSYYASENKISLNLFDLIEGSAYFFQKLLFQPDYNPENCSQLLNLPKVYTKAWNTFKEMGGTDPLNFLLFSHLALSVGLIFDKEDLNGHVISPLNLFAGLLHLMNELDDFPQSLPRNLQLNNRNIEEILETIGFEKNSETLLDHFHYRPNDQVNYFLDIAVRTWSIRTQLFNFMGHIGLSKSEYNNFVHLAENMQDVQKGFAGERREALQKTLGELYPALTDDILLPSLLAFELDALHILMNVNDLTKNTEFIGLLGTETVTVGNENELLDLTERFDTYLLEKNTFCCIEHGIVPPRKIRDCKNSDSLSVIIEKKFDKKINDLVEFV